MKKKLTFNKFPGKSFWKKYVKILKNKNDHTSQKDNLNLGKKIRSEVVSKHLDIPIDKINFIDHATGHAAYAYFSKKNNSRKTLVITLDAFGDHVNYSARLFENSTKGFLKIKKLVSGGDFIIGRLYRYITLILGLKPNEHEYKVMGLAPYCKKEYSTKILNYFNDMQKVSGVKFKFINKPKDLYFAIKNKLEDCRFDSIASGLQLYTEDLITKWIKNLIKKTNSNQICFAGGVAMNVKTNMLISKISKKTNLFVPACPDDASQAIGACYFNLLKERKKVFKNSFLNTAYLGPEAEKLSLKSKNKLKKNGFKIIDKDVEKNAAKLLFKNKIIGRYSGKAEFGARALGNRSILANPKNIEIKKKINEKIKSRDFWMPFAASVPEKYAKKYFFLDNKIDSYKFMTNCVMTKKLGSQNLAAAIHPYDMTCRPNILSKN